MASVALFASCGDLGLATTVPKSDAPVVVVGIRTPLRADAQPPADEQRAEQASPDDVKAPDTQLDAVQADNSEPDPTETAADPADTANLDAPTLPDLDPERVLIATSWQTFVYERPDFSSPKLGYLRSGTVVARAIEPEGFKGCAKGFYRIEPHGYVCVGKAASLDADVPLARINRSPNREAPLPYRYAEAGTVPPDFYTRLPKDSKPVRFHRAAWSELGLVERVPEFLADGSPSLRSSGERMSELQLVAATAVARSSFALIDVFEHAGRGWGVSSDLLLLPLDKLVPVEPSRFHGVELLPDAALPLVFVLEHNAYLYREAPHGGLGVERKLDYREAVLLTGEERRIGNQTFLRTRDGHFVVEGDHLVHIDGRSRAPYWAKKGRPWIDVSILKQALVAYVGMNPVYATLVSTGKDGLADPADSHSTIQGEFLIHTKHVTDEMSSDVDGDVYDHHDVPYVQFFKDGYALHAAYWHDGFGHPRSHGCINLSPEDARWLFEWSDPQVPAGWHGAMSLLDGTLVSIHP